MAPMARDGVEAVGSMGTDTPLAVLSDKPQLLYNYFKQLFAQVTNPPIDCIREEIITSAETTIGSERNLLKPDAGKRPADRAEVADPDQRGIRQAASTSNLPGFKSVTLPILFKAAEGRSGPGKGDGRSCARRPASAIATGVNIIDPVRSRRGHGTGADPGAAGRGRPASPPDPRGHAHAGRLVLESGEPREVHHFALLIGYGAGRSIPIWPSKPSTT